MSETVVGMHYGCLTDDAGGLQTIIACSCESTLAGPTLWKEDSILYQCTRLPLLSVRDTEGFHITPNYHNLDDYCYYLC